MLEKESYASHKENVRGQIEKTKLELRKLENEAKSLMNQDKEKKQHVIENKSSRTSKSDDSNNNGKYNILFLII